MWNPAAEAGDRAPQSLSSRTDCKQFWFFFPVLPPTVSKATHVKTWNDHTSVPSVGLTFTPLFGDSRLSNYGFCPVATPEVSHCSSGSYWKKLWEEPHSFRLHIHSMATVEAVLVRSSRWATYTRKFFKSLNFSFGFLTREGPIVERNTCEWYGLNCGDHGRDPSSSPSREVLNIFL